jgi:hypothetical protein
MSERVPGAAAPSAGAPSAGGTGRRGYPEVTFAGYRPRGKLV